MHLIEAGRGTLSASVALAEAEKLESTINDPHYSFEVAREHVHSAIESNAFDHAKSQLNRMLKCAYQTNDFHVLARAQGPFGDFYRAQENHAKALRWYWKKIATICKMPELCPFCLSDAFRMAGMELVSLGDCILANDRFGKALAIARIIPCRNRQCQTLQFLAQHFERHDDIREAVAAYVWLARLLAETDPTDEAANLNLLLGALSVKHGRETVRGHLNAVAHSAEKIVDEALAPYKLDDFIRKLGIKPNSAGDHW